MAHSIRDSKTGENNHVTNRQYRHRAATSSDDERKRRYKARATSRYWRTSKLTACDRTHAATGRSAYLTSRNNPADYSHEEPAHSGPYPDNEPARYVNA